MKLLAPNVSELTVGDVVVQTMHCAHPGILMRRGTKNPWPERHKKEFLPALKRALVDEALLPTEQLPTLSDLSRHRPGVTGEKSSEEFMRELRDSWDEDNQ